MISIVRRDDTSVEVPLRRYPVQDTMTAPDRPAVEARRPGRSSERRSGPHSFSVMWHVARRLLLGFVLILLASAGLLLSDTSRGRDQAQRERQQRPMQRVA